MLIYDMGVEDAAGFNHRIWLSVCNSSKSKYIISPAFAPGSSLVKPPNASLVQIRAAFAINPRMFTIQMYAK
jgi:hypothetical protein